ncbi:MAG: hypothetical protein GXY32_11405 [Ruminococcaceae bacterium]|nr:hypothetical protein [Oscillospiraceae bacterium]
MYPALEAVKWVHHGTVCFEGNNKVVWVDPYEVTDAAPKADIIIITHAHSDHYSPDDIARIMQPGTLFFTGKDVGPQLAERFGLNEENIAPLEDGEHYTLGNKLEITALPADNKNHPRGSGFGILLRLGDFRYYLSGDTDVLARNAVCDVLFCVCDGKYNMPDPLVRAVAQIQAMVKLPAVVVPYHFSNGDPTNGPRLAEELNRLGIESLVLGA